MEKIRNILKKREALLAVIILIYSAFVAIMAPTFLSYGNLTNVLKACSVTGIFSLGVLIIIISGGFDVSFTAIAQVTEYFCVYFMVNWFTHGNLLLTLLLASLVGALMGLFNGFLIDHFKMPAIIITISTQNLFYGLMYVVTRGKLLYTIPEYIWPLADGKLFKVAQAVGSPNGFSYVTVLWFVMAVILDFVLRKTTFGRTIYWVGGNRTAAKRVGVNMFRNTMLVYGIAGAIVGIGSIAHVAIVQTVIPNSIVGTEMAVIAAIILGGASISGGRGSVLGSILGVLLFQIVNNSLTLLKISSYWYNVFTGAIIILSLILNATQEIQQKRQIIRVKVASDIKEAAV
ncbi:ABC transporter permease [Sphaerochaeta globosa]|uniref:ABC-type transporter, integral membrane subunit n=1 Tax=Sphaerochaeta globosa (strain ATCC BAA-1886 / DSM 22777 / Buddy) TaxID=158189 RepID=F0RRH9_SPHGB|nr:ABC transporter permease [Sphaerochaeta globosa]ADY14231.1 ABC-type transporter, integral membrane subunit [Sphaerochaeta globosa str. Buddy]